MGNAGVRTYADPRAAAGAPIQEAHELIGRAKSERRAPGTLAVYRNGFNKECKLGTSMGTISARLPRVRGLDERFDSRILPLFKRRTQEIGKLLPELYLHGLAMGVSSLRCAAHLVMGLRCRAHRSPACAPTGKCGTRAGGSVHSRAGHRILLGGRSIRESRLEAGKAALLVIIGATRTGEKVLLAVEGGLRESTESWRPCYGT